MGDRVGQFKVNFCPRMAIKGQPLSDFIAEFIYSNTTKVTGMVNNAEASKVAGVREKENSVPTEGDAE